MAGGKRDGIIAKRLDTSYQSGERTGMQKIKRLRTRFDRMPETPPPVMFAARLPDNQKQLIGDVLNVISRELKDPLQAARICRSISKRLVSSASSFATFPEGRRRSSPSTRWR